MPRKLDEDLWRLERKFDEASDELDAQLAAKAPSDAGARAELASYRYGKDYDRLLYSGAFRKLGGVTQVVTATELGTFHNRLTHSLKVAQTAGLICGNLQRRSTTREREIIVAHGGLHPTVVRSACLAHDIGHPPFGHIGELAIQEILAAPDRFIQADSTDRDLRLSASPDSFEGNAQSFRVVTRLAFREEPFGDEALNPALNLTRATLAALSKYPWDAESKERTQKRNKYGAYKTEAALLTWAMEQIPKDREGLFHGRPVVENRSIEAQVMDWADDIAYAVHDAEDFFRAGLIPLDAIGAGGREFKAFVRYAVDKLRGKLPVGVERPEIEDLLGPNPDPGRIDVLGLLPKKPYDGSRDARIVLHNFASSLIHAATQDMTVTANGILIPERDIYVIIEVLKKLTEYYVIDRPVLGSAQRGQRQILIEVVAGLYQWAVMNLQQDARNDSDQRRSEKFALPARLNDYFEICDSLLGETSAATFGDRVLRAVIDYVSSLTDEQTIALHARMCKGDVRSMLEPWLFL